MENINYTLLVVDFDSTFDSVDDDDIYGVKPEVYMIDSSKVELVESLAGKAHDLFHECEEEYECMCIGEIFEELMQENEIKFSVVGSLDIPFDERQDDYLEKGINVVYI